MAALTIPFQSIGALLAGHAARHPDMIAIFDLESGNNMNFSSLRDAVERIAALLEKLGVGPGDQVALLCDERIKKIMIFLAIWRIGPSPVHFMWKAA